MSKLDNFVIGLLFIFAFGVATTCFTVGIIEYFNKSPEFGFLFIPPVILIIASGLAMGDTSDK
jgi:hypothetical protein